MINKISTIVRYFLGFAVCTLLLGSGLGHAAFQDDPADPDGDGFSNGEEQLMGTDPNAANQDLSDVQLLTLIQKRNFDYFWLESQAPHFFTADRGVFNQVGQGSNAKSIATTGFALTAISIADQNGWVDHVDAYNRIRATLFRLRQMQQTSDVNLHKRGFFYHFIDADGNRLADGGFNSELSPIDQALLLAGVLFVAEYYKGTEAEQLARELYENTEWEFMFDGQFFYQGWVPNGGPAEGGTYFQERWDSYSELMILLLLGIGSPTHPVTAQTWNDIGRPVATYKTSAPYVHVGPLFAHQFSHVWIDFRSKRDRFGIDYYENSIRASLVNRRFTIDLSDGDPVRYNTYGVNSWGLSSADSSTGYRSLEPLIFSNDPTLIESFTDSGTVVPAAALGSVPFTPFESTQAALNWFTNHRAETFGRYGFRNAFNLGVPSNAGSASHFPSSKIGLDCGTTVSMIENFRTGLVWKYFSRNSSIRNAMNAVGFVSDSLPSGMDFDDDTPGQDPNSFGGSSGVFGPGASSSYPSITSVMTISEGVSGHVWRIAATGVDAGAFNTLNGHDISRFDTLSFFIRGGVGGEQVRVGLKDLSNTEFTVSVSEFIDGGVLTTDYKQVQIPLSVFSNQRVRLTTMDNISFRFTASGGGEIFIDDIAFIADQIRPAAPINVAGAISGSDVNLAWSHNAENDLVGYNVYRATNENGPFTKLNPLVFVDNSFKDANVLADPNAIFYYHIKAVDNAAVPNESVPSAQVVLPNRGPQLDAIGSKTVIAGNLLAFTVSASDPNDDPLTFSASNLPSGASFNPVTRIFSWNPTVAQVGVFKNIRFSVTDGAFTDFEEITIAVADNAVGSLDFTVQEIDTDRSVTGGIEFGTVGSTAGFTQGAQRVRVSALSNSNNWKVQIYTDNATNSMTLIHMQPIRQGHRGQFVAVPVVTQLTFSGSGSAGGLIGEQDSSYCVPLKWAIFPDKVPQSGLPTDASRWGTVLDKGDSGFSGNTPARLLLDANGNLGVFPSTGRTATGADVYLYLAADFTGVPAQSYSTSRLLLELFTQ